MKRRRHPLTERRLPSSGGRLRILHSFAAACVFAWAGTAVAPSPAAAEGPRLTVRAPAGAEILVDGSAIGTAPIPPITLTEGAHEVEARLPGYLSQKKGYYARPIRGESLIFYMKRKTRTGALLRSTLVPGWGSLYNGNRPSAIAWFVIEASLVAYAISQDSQFGDDLEAYESALARYENAVSDAEIAEARRARDAAYDDLGSTEDRREAAIWAAVGVHVVSMADAYFRFPFGDLPFHPEVAARPDGDAITSEFALRWEFR